MNYNGVGATTTAGAGGVLAMTGSPGVLWWLLAAFALICLGGAIWRMIPRNENDNEDA